MFRIQGLLLPAAAFCALLGLVVVGSTTAPREADRLDPNDEVETAGFQGPGGPGPGGPGGPGGPPGGFGPGMFLAPGVMEAADANKDGRLAPQEAGKAAEAFVRDADTQKKGSLDLAGLREAINRKVGPPPGAGPDDGGGPPPGFGPGMFMAPRILELADANKDGRLAPDEAARAAEGFIREVDRDSKGLVNEEALASAINRGMGPPLGFGPGGPMGQERKLVKDFDKDADGRLNRTERLSARESIKKDRAAGGRGGRGGRGFGPPGGFGREESEPPKPGKPLQPADVPSFPGRPLYEPTVLRTLFLEFPDKDWEAEVADFYHTDVEVPATLVVDGKAYPNVGVHNRGLSSFMGVGEGDRKRSLNLSLDFVDPNQRLLGYKTLNLLNAHEDPSFLHTVLYLHIARQYIPATRANFVRVVINGESWGLYVNAQQFDRIFLTENYRSGKGARWKVPGNPGADGGLRYLGEDVEEYKRRFQIKTGDDLKDWKALIALCKTLDQTPRDQLERALEPLLDIDGTLWFLALDNALINGDGYWTRASDYSICRDERGKFHMIPHDTNETFGPPMMFGPPGGFGGRGRGGFGRGRGGPGPGRGGPGAAAGGPPGGGPRPPAVDLDPLVGLDDTRKPLRSRLLAVPSLRARYLDHVRTIVQDWLDWDRLGPVVAQYRTMIEPEVEADTRKLTSLAAFRKAVAETPEEPAAPGGRGSGMSLRTFADRRRKFLLSYRETPKPSPSPSNNRPNPEAAK